MSRAKVPVEDFMTRRVVTIAPDTTLLAAAKVMLEHRVGGLPVLDASGRIIGVFSESDLLREEGEDGSPGGAGGVFHCFTETAEVARAALDLGFYISFSGIVTFKNAKDLKEVARRVPLERMLIETDAPYLAPVPFRGKLNQPAYVRYVAEEIARLRTLPVDDVAQTTSANFFRLFAAQ
jgi:Tat protein secretion system quality control protein TatD with DNase activity